MARTLSTAQIVDRALNEFRSFKHDPRDPSPWLALYMDRSLPMDVGAKAVYLKNCNSKSRQFLLPILRPFCRFFIGAFKLMRTIIPDALHSSKALHYLIYLGQKYFVSPEANYILLRHFHIGSQVLKFIETNVPGFTSPVKPINPVHLRDIYKQEIYLNHDLNLYNFIIALNEHFRETKTTLHQLSKVNFSALREGTFGIDGFRESWLNFLDAESAIEIFTPVYEFFLRDSDFYRAHHSLQFDETIAIYTATMLGATSHLSLVNNRHPLAPMPGYSAAGRLVLHGIAAEVLHGLLSARHRAEVMGSETPMVYQQPKGA